MLLEEETILLYAILLLKLYTSKLHIQFYTICHQPMILSANLVYMEQYKIHIISSWHRRIFHEILTLSCRENICHIVKAPANVPWKIRKLATDIASRAVSSLEGAGLFAVELFLTVDDQVLFYLS